VDTGYIITKLPEAISLSKIMSRSGLGSRIFSQTPVNTYLHFDSCFARESGLAVLPCVYRTQCTVVGSVFGVISLCFLFVYEISPELLNGYAPNSRGRHVGSLAWTSLKVKVKGQDHQGQKTAFFWPSAACVWFVWFMLASSFSSDFSRRKPLGISSTGFL